MKKMDDVQIRLVKRFWGLFIFQIANWRCSKIHIKSTNASQKKNV